MSYRSQHFKIAELVCPEILAVLEEEAAWLLIPQSVQMDLDALRSAFGASISINGNGRTLCGVRPKTCTTGATKSRHKLGYPGVFAFDLHATDLDKLRQLIMTRSREFGIVRMEDPKSTSGWCHIEISTDVQPGGLNIFKP